MRSREKRFFGNRGTSAGRFVMEKLIRNEMKNLKLHGSLERAVQKRAQKLGQKRSERLAKFTTISHQLRQKKSSTKTTRKFSSLKCLQACNASRTMKCARRAGEDQAKTERRSSEDQANERRSEECLLSRSPLFVFADWYILIRLQIADVCLAYLIESGRVASL